jgi:hypothetical protein
VALTTATSQQISDNLVSDVNANVPAPNASRPRSISPEAAILFDKSIVARPLNTPEVCSIHVKNTEYYYRWVYNGSNGVVYSQRKAMGFTNATTDDVELLVGNATADNGEIRAGDLILMKLPYHRWASHVKANMLRAKTLGDMRGVYNKTDVSTSVFDDTKPARVSVSQEPFMRGKVDHFIPDNPDAIIDDSINAGRVNTTRATMTDMRDKIDSEKRG